MHYSSITQRLWLDQEIYIPSSSSTAGAGIVDGTSGSSGS